MKPTARLVRRALGAGIGVCLLSSAAMALRAPSQGAPAPAASRAKPVIRQVLPAMDGTKLAVTLVEVNYGPGESSTAHSHPCPVIGYIVSGAMRMQVKGEPERVYTAGQTFYEPPNGVHQVSANASQTEPAKLVAYFTCDRETPLSVPPPAGAP